MLAVQEMQANACEYNEMQENTWKNNGKHESHGFLFFYHKRLATLTLENVLTLTAER